MIQFIAFIEEVPFTRCQYKSVRLFNTNTNTETILSFSEFIDKFPPTHFSMHGTPLGHLGCYDNLQYTTILSHYDSLKKQFNKNN